REQEGAEEGQEHGGGHGQEELALDAGQCEDGQVDDGDDDLPIDAGGAHLQGGRLDDLDALRGIQGTAGGGLRLGQAAHGVLDDDDGAVHQEPEVDGAQAHQVAGEPEGVHEKERDQQGEGNGQGHHQSGAQVAQNEEEDEQDQ